LRIKEDQGRHRAAAIADDGMIVMDDLYYVYATAGVIVAYFLAQLCARKFDPFAPTWLFFVGYVQVYIIQAISYHEWAVGVRGKELVTAANFRALWALLWFLLVYECGIGKRLAGLLPSPPRGWSTTTVSVASPAFIVWGLFCAGLVIFGGQQNDSSTASGEASLFRSFPFMMMVAAVLLIVTGRTNTVANRVFLPAGVLAGAFYVLIWMFNGKRSHSLIGVLATVCALYVSRLKRPSWPVLIATGFAGALVVAIAIGWRGNENYERSFTGFFHFLGDFKVTKILESLNITDEDESVEAKTYETAEYGGFLLMMDTVPESSEYDYGESYLRVFSTFIPRLVWPTKPIYGRAQWVNAWIAGSEMKREDDFTGPAIGILGATQLNGGAVGTLIVLACIATLLSTAYAYFRLHAASPWTQFWWAITYYNAWFMVVNDDPLVWFYYNWGFSTFPVVILMWWTAKWGAAGTQHKLVAQPAI
jgi:hypothetical protein